MFEHTMETWNSTQRWTQKISLLMAFCVVFGIGLLATPAKSAPSIEEERDRVVSRLLSSFYKKDYAAFRKLSKSLPLDFSEKDFNKFQEVLQTFGPPQRIQRSNQNSNDKNKQGSLYRLYFAKGKFHLLVVFQDAKITKFKFGGKELEARITAMEKEASRKLGITDFDILNSAGFPHLSSGPIPPGLIRYRLKIRGLKKKDGQLWAHMDIFLQKDKGYPKAILVGKRHKIDVLPTVVQPVWSVRGGLHLKREGTYTLIFVVTDAHTKKSARFQKTLDIKKP